MNFDAFIELQLRIEMRNCASKALLLDLEYGIAWVPKLFSKTVDAVTSDLLPYLQNEAFLLTIDKGG